MNRSPIKLVYTLTAVLWSVLLASLALAHDEPPPAELTAEQRQALVKEREILRKSVQLVARVSPVAAIDPLEQQLAVERKLFGNATPELLETLGQLAGLHERRDDFPSATKAREEIIRITVVQVGDKHWRVIDARQDLAYTQKLKELSAEQRTRLATARSLRAKALDLANEKKLTEAIASGEQALEIYSELIGDHPRTAVVLYDLAIWQRDRGNSAKTRELLERCLKIEEAALGADHPSVALTLIYLAQSMRATDVLAAWTHASRALDLLTRVVGPDDSKTRGARQFRDSLRESVQTRLLDVAGKQAAAGNNPAAIQSLEERLKIQRELKRTDGLLLQTLDRLGELYLEQGEFAKARGARQEVLDLRISQKFAPHIIADARLDVAHVDAVERLSPEDRQRLQAATELNVQAIRNQTDLAQALEAAKQALQIRRDLLGEEHPLTALSLYNLGSIHRDLGQLAEAQACLERSLASRRQTLGDEHPSTARTLNDLGLIHQDRGQRDEAIKCLEQSLAIKTKVHGAQAPETLTTQRSLGLVLREQGKFPEARRHFETLLEIRQKSGFKNLPLAQALDDLGSVLQDLGELETARKHFEQCLVIYKSIRRENHLDTARVLNNLGVLLDAQQKRPEAIVHLQRAVAIAKQLPGGEPVVARYLHNLGSVCRNHGDYPQARKSLEEALAIYERQPGENSLSQAKLRQALGCVLLKLGERKAARENLDSALAIFQAASGERHPDAARVINDLGLWHQEGGDFRAAREYFEKALEILREVLDAEHPEVLVAMGNLGTCLQASGDYPAARKIQEQALAISQRVLGAQHPDTGVQRMNLGTTLSEMGECLAAQEHWEAALAIFTKSLGPDHPYLIRTLLNLGRLHREQAQFVDSRRCLEQALALCRKNYGDDNAETATTLNYLGLLLVVQGDFAGAKRNYDESLAIFRKSVGDQHPGTADVLVNLAAWYGSMGRFTEAQQHFEQALDSLRHVFGERHDAIASAVLGLAHITREQGDYTATKRHCEAALAMFRQIHGEKHNHVAVALYETGPIYSALGDYDAAQANCRAAVEIIQQIPGDHRQLLSQALQNWGRVHFHAGAYVAARRAYEQSFELRQELFGKDHPLLIESLEHLGVLVNQQGDYAAAQTYLQRALALRQMHFGSDHPQTAFTYNNLATLLMDQGDLPGAQAYLERTLPVFRKAYGEEHPETNTARNNLALVLEKRQQYAEARRLFDETLQLNQRIWGPDHPRVATSLNNLGLLLHHQGDQEAALKYIGDALAIDRRTLGDHHPHTAARLHNLGFIHLELGQHQPAAECLREALQIEVEFGSGLLSTLSEAEGLARAQNATGSRDALLTALERLPDVKPAEAYQWVWETRGLASRALAGRRPPADGAEGARKLWDELTELRRQLANLTFAAAGIEQAAERRERLAALSAQKERLERRLAENSESFHHKLQAEKVHCTELAKLLPPGVAMVDLVRVRPHLARARVEKSGWPWHYDAFVLRRLEQAPGYSIEWVHLGPAEPIESAVRAWREAVFQQPKNSAAETPDQIIRRLVWQPVEEHLAKCNTVILIPDAALTAIPWSALPGREVGSFLIEDYAIGTATYGQHLLAMLTEEPAKQGEAIIVGGVDYDGPASKSADQPTAAPVPPRRGPWAHLVGTDQEAAAIAKLAPQGQACSLVQRQEASEANLRSLLPRAKYVHLATHGFFLEPNPRAATPHAAEPDQRTIGGDRRIVRNPLALTGVVLAGANTPVATDSWGSTIGDDGVLTGEEVASLDLRRTDLVVLSACETGIGEVAGGEGVFGLQRAFAMAGGRSVVASLWKVDDSATQTLMTEFYRNLWEQKLGKVAALRQAQLTMLRQYDRVAGKLQPRGLERVEARPGDSKDRRLPPYFWAAFVLSGDWR